MAIPLEEAIEFADNPEPRCACVLVLDMSHCMRGDPINQLNQGLQYFKECLERDDLAARRTEIAVLAYAYRRWLLHDFSTVYSFKPPELWVSDYTVIPNVFEEALDMVEERKETYRANGITYYRPWVWFMTDGTPYHPTRRDLGRDLARPLDRLAQAYQARQVEFFPVGVRGADMAWLNGMLPGTSALHLQGLKFNEMFEWLANSLSSVCQSRPGDDRVPLAAPTNWGEV